MEKMFYLLYKSIKLGGGHLSFKNLSRNKFNTTKRSFVFDFTGRQRRNRLDLISWIPYLIFY